MGCCWDILTFGPKYTKRGISDQCDAWANHNCDPMEHGGSFDCGGLPGGVVFTGKIFDTESEAREYLHRVSPRYEQIAVQFKKRTGKPLSPTQKLMNARKKVQELSAKYNELERKPHYAGVSSKTVSCKSCGSNLATAFCGKTYGNQCPVCKCDLRPPSTLENIARVKKNLLVAQKELQALEHGFEVKQTSGKYELWWAVACGVHY